MQKLARAALAALTGVTLVSCGGGEGPSAPKPVLATLRLSFPQTTIFIGQSANALVDGLDQFGAPIATGVVTWSTSSTAIATVTASGVVTGSLLPESASRSHCMSDTATGFRSRSRVARQHLPGRTYLSLNDVLHAGNQVQERQKDRNADQAIH